MYGSGGGRVTKTDKTHKKERNDWDNPNSGKLSKKEIKKQRKKKREQDPSNGY